MMSESVILCNEVDSQLTSLQTVPNNPAPAYLGSTVMQAPVVGVSYMPQPLFRPVPGTVNSTTVIVQQPLIGRSPTSCYCQYCHCNIVTKTDYEIPSQTWLLCCIISLLCGILPGLIPLCIDNCKDVRHRCPNCGQTIAVSPRNH